MNTSLASQNYHRELRVTRVPVAWQVAAAGGGHASSPVAGLSFGSTRGELVQS